MDSHLATQRNPTRYHNRFNSMAERSRAADPAKPPDRIVIENEAARRLDQAIGRLPSALKAALLLTAFEGYSQIEAGKMLGVSDKTIETRVYRARKLLAGTLDDELRPGSP